MLGEIMFEIAARRQIDRILPRLLCDLLHQRLPADARDRCLARCIDVRQEEQIRCGKACAELFAQQLRTRIAMRLKHTDEPPRVRLTRRSECCGNLRRVMRIVIHHPNAALLALRLETALCPMKLCERTPNLRELHTSKTRHSNAGKRIEHVVPPRNVE